MDAVKDLFDNVHSYGRLGLEKVGIVQQSNQSIFQWARSLDWRVQSVLMIMATMSSAFFIMVFLANYVYTQDVPEAIKDKLTPKAGAPAIPPPTEVTSLRVYPIKSCRGFEVNSTRLRKMGLTLDRNWMFITKSDKKFITIRGDSSMTLIDTNLVEDEKTKEQMLQISIHGSDSSVRVPAFPSKEWLEKNTSLETVEIWEQETDGYIYGEEINKPFSDFFGKPVALVYNGPTPRLCRVNGSKEMYGQDIATNFGDVMSLQVASEASIKDLNRRLVEKNGKGHADLTIERFRPNIIVKGRDDHPWEEDTWKRIRITTRIEEEQALYKLDLDAVARCARCQVPNVDPDTAEKNAKEPWDELMKFRRVDSGGPAKYKPCFGMLCIPRSEGKIEVGAKVEVLETTGNHLYNVRKFGDL